MATAVKHKCGYRLCNNSVWGLKPKRKFCIPEHAQREQYLAKHPEARANQLISTKPAKRGRAAVTARICKFPGCRESIEQRSKTALFCYNPKHTATRLKAHVAAENKAKKKRYDARHGIVRDKTVRQRDALPGKQALEKGTAKLWNGEALLYTNYKEPLREVEKGKGYGYYGTIGITADNAFIQCHVCGHLYQSVGAHVRKHKMSAERYKVEYGLKATAALVSEPARERLMSKVVSTNITAGKGLPVWLQEYNKKVQSGEVKHVGTKRKEGGMSLQKRNEIGYCPDQVLEKIKDLADKLGHTPSQDDFIAEYDYKYLHSIGFQHGSWTAAVKKLGLQTRNELRSINKDKLIAELQDFQKINDRIPMTSDFNRGMLRDKNSYIRAFGSLNNARVEAGMNAILPMPFGQKVELTAEQYMEYQAGHIDPRSTTKAARASRALRKRKAYARNKAKQLKVVA